MGKLRQFDDKLVKMKVYKEVYRLPVAIASTIRFQDLMKEQLCS
jgi:hypothetical protein